MRLLYVSNHRFIRTKSGEIYTTGQMGEKYFNRFRRFFDSVTVIGLCEEENENNIKRVIDKVEEDEVFLNYILIESSGTIPGIVNALRQIKKKYIEMLPSHDRVATKAPGLIANTAVKIARKNNIPILVEMVGCPWDAYWNHSLKGKFIAPIMWHQTRGAVKEAPYVVYVTNKFLQGRYPTIGNTTNCSNVSLNEFNEDIIKDRLIKIGNKNDNDKIVIGTTAAVNVKYKGQQYIIKALGKLKQQGICNFEYQLVGGGDQSFLRSVAEQYNVTDQIKFLGSLPHKSVFEWLDNLDLYVQPSRQEGLPRALIEAMSRGLPSFGAKTAGIPELLENDYIFSNSKNNISEICDILSSFTKEKMLKQAKRNYKESKNYEKSTIDSRRNNLLRDFIG